MNKELTDPTFWEEVEAGDVIAAIATLEAIPERSKKENKQLATLRIRLNQVKVEAARLAALNKKWQSGGEGKQQPVLLTGKNAEAIFADSPVREAGKHYCSFCGSEVDAVNLTRGTGKPRVTRILEETGSGDDIVTHERLLAQVPKEKACPNCVNLIRKPVVIRTV